MSISTQRIFNYDTPENKSELDEIVVFVGDFEGLSFLS